MTAHDDLTGATSAAAFDLATAFGPVPESARRFAASIDPGEAAAWVSQMALQVVFPDRRDDPMFCQALARSALDNIDAMWRIIAGRAALDATAPLGAYAFAETAAEVGVPVSQFERVYRVGTGLTWIAWYRAAKVHAEQTGTPLHELIEAPTAIIHAYLDASLSPTLERYDASRAESRRTRDQLQRNVLRQALARVPAQDEHEVAHALGVNLGGEYVAFAVHGERLDHLNVVEPAKRAAEASTVFSYQHRPDAWLVWLWRHDRYGPARLKAFKSALLQTGGLVGLSDAHQGIEGVGATGRDALEAGRIQSLLGQMTGVLAYTDVRLEAMLLRDPAEARRFVQAELGDLNAPGSRLDKLRETAMLYLSTGSHVSTAARLRLHEHTVRNRVAQVEEVLGYTIVNRRTELLVALRLLRMLEQAASAEEPSEPAWNEPHAARH